jgi:uncharacterized protein (TIGR04255 family)
MSKLYRAPPIFEAIVQFSLTQNLTGKVKARLLEKAKEHYGKEEISFDVDVQVSLDNSTITTRAAEPRKVHILSNNDQTEFLKIEDRKLSWWRLPPYDCWESIKNRIMRDLQSFPKKVGIPSLERIGMRYRNRIDIPAAETGLCHYEDYLSVNLSLPTLLDPHDAYKWTVAKYFPSRNLAAFVNFEIVTSEIPNTMAVLLDIDAFADQKIPRTKAQLELALEELRTLKNEIFEACVTDKARASFQ